MDGLDWLDAVGRCRTVFDESAGVAQWVERPLRKGGRLWVQILPPALRIATAVWALRRSGAERLGAILAILAIFGGEAWAKRCLT